MPNEEKKVNAIVDREIDAAVAGDAKGRVFSKDNVEQVTEASKGVLKGALTGAAKGALKGAVIGAFEGAIEGANQEAAKTAGEEPISDEPAKLAN